MKLLSWGNILLVAAIGFTLFIVVGSLVHAPKILEEAPQNTDKVIHLFLYSILTSLWICYAYLYGLRAKSLKYSIVVIIFCVLLFGMLIEVLQGTLTDYRSEDIIDMVANSVGIGIAVILIIIFNEKLKYIKSRI